MVQFVFVFASLLLIIAVHPTLATSSGTPSKPHIVMHLVDDWGWANAGWHANEGNTKEVRTPRMDQLVKEGIEMDRAYSFQFCSPTRSSLQSGRYPSHVNDKNADVTIHNPDDPVSGFAAIPRNMTGMAAKLKLGGYKTHQVGKWDAGMATWDHTPVGRGYDTSFGYFHHDNDYFNDKAEALVDLWDTRGPGFGMNSSCEAYYGKPNEGCEQPGSNPSYTVGPEMIYEEKIFVDRCLEMVEDHPKEDPFFLNYCSHIVHSPLQAPAMLYHSFDFMTNDYDKHRQIYASMVAYLDTGVGKIVDALKGEDMWNNTIWFCQSDNGGPSFTGDNHTANNFPLRGAKYSNWEGGVRVNAFVSGGYLAKVAPQRIGTKLDGFIHICDYYTTFAAIAGVDPTDTRAALAKLPPVDGLNLWPYISGQVEASPRTEVWNDLGVLIMGKFKLYNASGPYGKLVDPESGSLTMTEGHACRPGMVYPNGTDLPGGAGAPAEHGTTVNGTGQCAETQECPGGACLYNIFDDPTEHRQLSGLPGMDAQIAKMRSRLAALEATYFNPKRGSSQDGLAKRTAIEKWGGYWGPFVFP